MKYEGIYWTILSPAIKSSIKQRFGDEMAKKAIKNGKTKYREILAEAPDLGKGNPMASNAYFAYVFVAAYLGADGGMKPEDIADVMRDVLKKMSPFFGMTDLNKDPKKWSREMRKYRKWYEAGNGAKYPTTWKVELDDTLHRDGDYYALTACPICNFLTSKGMGDVMKPLCELDAVMFAYQHGVLHRDHTIASGADYCDYWIVPDKIKDPQ